MNVIIRYIVISLVIIGLSSCKDEPPKDSIPGVYEVSVRVIQRPAVYPTAKDTVSGYIKKFHGAFISEGEGNVCCEDWGGEHGCPMEYTFSPFEIIKTSNGYSIKNDILISPEGVQNTYDIELMENKDSLVFNGTQTFSRSLYLGKQYQAGNRDLLQWPKSFDLHYFSLKKEANNTLKGKWFFMDQSSGCLFSTLGYQAQMGEYAKLILTKIE